MSGGMDSDEPTVSISIDNMQQHRGGDSNESVSTSAVVNREEDTGPARQQRQQDIVEHVNMLENQLMTT